jgi:hypothetical protein
MFGTKELIDFHEFADGTWGEFATGSGRVSFLMTNARLGSPKDTDRASRLTRLLSPVREVLEVKNLNFNQLLQRDLDDHRVATALLPYVLKDKATGPGFFPPILAVLLPFEGNVAVDSFPDSKSQSGQKLPEYGDSLFDELRFGGSFRVNRMTLESGNYHPVRLGRISWNPETAKLVVIDGQHRAMALLAIQRTLTDSWKGSSGEKYRYFYEGEVKRLLKESGGTKASNFAGFDFPVTICWFPDMGGPSARPHVAARKLFVDVNQNARQPSQSRLVLLSDTELVNVFARTLLNRLREEDPPLPLFAVEYDNPDSRSYRPVRWSVVTNLLILRDIVERVVFGPRKYITKVDITVKGQPGVAEMDVYFREQFELAEFLPAEIDEGASSPNLPRAAIGNECFPQYNKEMADKLKVRFMDLWGKAILEVLGRFHPWQCHIEALNELAAGWMAGDAAVSSLAKDALFEGVGMYWTLRDADVHWKEQVSSNTTIPEIVQAWRLIDRGQAGGKAQEFFSARAKKYLGHNDSSSVAVADEVYGVLNTYACQLGALLTVASVRNVHQNLTPYSVASTLVDAWNSAIKNGHVDGRRRRYFCRSEQNSINQLAKMDSPDAVYFRYFFLELLCSEEAQKLWDGKLETAKLEKLCSAARVLYRERLISDIAKSLKKTKPGIKDSEREKEARFLADGRLRDALKYFFKWKLSDYDEWVAQIGSQKGSVATDSSEVETSLEVDALDEDSESSEESD